MSPDPSRRPPFGPKRIGWGLRPQTPLGGATTVVVVLVIVLIAMLSR